MKKNITLVTLVISALLFSSCFGRIGKRAISRPMKVADLQAAEEECRPDLPENVAWACELLNEANRELVNIKEQKDASEFVNKYVWKFVEEVRFPTKGKTEIVHGDRRAVRTEAEQRELIKFGRQLNGLMIDLRQRCLDTDEKWYWEDHTESIHIDCLALGRALYGLGQEREKLAKR
jgi:hypothetical protein